MKKLIEINIQTDKASIIELEKCLANIELDIFTSRKLAEFSSYCHSLIEQLCMRLAQDTKFQSLLEKQGINIHIYSQQNWEINLLLCSDDRITEWNHQFRDKNKPTDILSFPSEELFGGDLILSIHSWLRNCSEFDCSLMEELQRLLLHGLLHLAGLEHYEDETPENPKSPMLLYQEVLLKNMFHMLKED